MDAQDAIKELAQRIQETANGKAVFGEPIREGGATIVPVSRIMLRGGGGGGTGDIPPMGPDGPGPAHGPGKGRGMGIGLNVVTAPVGYIQLTESGAEFVPIVDRNRAILGGMVVAGLALLVIKAGLKYSRR